MIKKTIVAIVVIVAAAAMVFAAGSSDQNNTAGNSNQENQQIDSSSNSSTSNNIGENTTISAAEAKKIAEKYIEEPGASAGTPTLSKQDNKSVYIVPILYNGENVGEINIDAQTGENLGGAGGAP